MNLGKTFAKRLALAAAVVGGMFAAQANAVVILDKASPYYVGEIVDGIPAGAETDYMNVLIDLAPGAGATACVTELCNRIGSTVDLSGVADVGAGDKTETGDGNNIALNGAVFILAKYANTSSLVWYVANIADLVSVGGVQQGFSHYTLFGATTTTVPEPATLGLLGLGLLGVGLARRRRKA